MANPGASSAWLWRPSQIVVQDHYRTLVTEFETGWEQRREKWATPRMSISMRFDKPNLSLEEMVDIWVFFRRQHGSQRPFDLPTFTPVTHLTSQYANGTLTLANVSAFTTGFSPLDYPHFASLYVENRAGDQAIFKVTSTDGATLYVTETTGPSSFAFDIGDLVSPVINARFDGDVWGPEYLPAQLTTLGINFIQVRQ